MSDMKNNIKESITYTNEKNKNNNKESTHQVRMVKQQEPIQHAKKEEQQKPKPQQPQAQHKKPQSVKQMADEKKESRVVKPNISDHHAEKKTPRSPSQEKEKMAAMIQQVEKEVKNIENKKANKSVPLSEIMEEFMEEEKSPEQEFPKKTEMHEIENKKEDSMAEATEGDKEENTQEAFSFFEDLEDLNDW